MTLNGHKNDTENTKESNANTFGWFCTLLHDYPEPEGIVWFAGRPEPGIHFMLPSSNYTEEWEVRTVNDHDMSITAVKPNKESILEEL